MTVADDIVAERAALVTALAAVGPDAPTVVDGGRACDVARHLAAQDRFRAVPAFIARALVVRTGVRLTASYLDKAHTTAFINGRQRPWQWYLGRLSMPPPPARPWQPLWSGGRVALQ